eukprot:CAMPEP_0115024214 /NCGR_PEP_ID=MMETSP0216-20121206/33040_1 /TAXON_ID=223996 /ORGANISM="Protocruzia adherens, Strain Boccale" /LENGTH=474 /DNA_ID=CAMNT_0002398101 /DNA_START=38 /DNA_END=1458 /DNA_ORIENTATION=-
MASLRMLFVYALGLLFAPLCSSWELPGNFTLSVPDFPQKVVGEIDECCCKVETLDEINSRILPILKKLTNTDFFLYYQVDLEEDCPFWAQNLFCQLSTCSVCECEEDTLPLPWKDDKTDNVTKYDDMFMTKRDESDLGDVWFHEGDPEKMIWVNMRENPEAFTAYQGQKIWEAVYSENCFQGDLEDMCTEERMLYRIISGLHANVNTHISSKFHGDNGEVYRNNTMFNDRVLYHPDRIKNLHYLYSVLLRAVTRAAEIILHYNYNTGNLMEETKTKKYVAMLLDETLNNCDRPFDESELFLSPSKLDIKREIQQHVYNITQIMDCVGCEKCRLHGKLQLNGIATALKVLFTDEEVLKKESIKRNDLVAFINTVSKLSRSISLIEDYRQDEIARISSIRNVQFAVVMAAMAVGMMLTILLIVSCNKDIPSDVNSSDDSTESEDDTEETKKAKQSEKKEKKKSKKPASKKKTGKKP